ncbi:MAG TPA: glycosyltransferase [Gemmatimonadaceae bacterium]|nr:glycosyltransferase [Gemmatimonadaceae bacterium]
MVDPAPGATTEATPIAVVLATRNCAVGADLAARSVMASRYPAFRLFVVDQSADDSTTNALQHFADDRRVTVERMQARGLAAARNFGVARTDAPIIAFTDDDCEVEPDWMRAIATAFASDERIGIVFGAVRAASYDRGAGFIPAYAMNRALTVRSISRKARIEGLGACMAVRRSAWQLLNGFDELFGAGAPLRSGEESDFTMRALLRGFSAHETPAAAVTHHGFRTWGEGIILIDGYMFGLGAANAKMLRLGGLPALKPVAELAWRWLTGEPVVDLNHRPPRLRRLAAFLRGTWWGFRMPLDTATGRFKSGHESIALMNEAAAR